MRISTRVDYAIRAMAELAAAQGGRLTAEQLGEAQDVSPKFLRSILTDLSRAQLLRSSRGPDGGYVLARPAEEISIANVYRAIDGRLVELRDQSLATTTYPGAAGEVPVVWMAVVASLRRLLESTTIADVAAGALPDAVRELAEEYRSPASRPTAGRG